MPTAPPPAEPLPTVEAHPWYGTAHHGDGRFVNPWRSDGDAVPPLKAARWMLTFPFRRKPDQRPAERVALDAAALAEPPSGARLTWLGHSTVLLQIGPTNILTDPVFAERASPTSFAGPARAVPLPLDPADLPPIHLVLIGVSLSLAGRQEGPASVPPMGRTIPRLGAPPATGPRGSGR
ncbi:MAG: hypothetical protein R3362_05875, partial [Rhodothermales bacterium]|nr:hypothetical protein [Rhodothermales bacterium]